MYIYKYEDSIHNERINQVSKNYIENVKLSQCS